MTKIQFSKTAFTGAIICLLAVAIGAFGSHALKDILIVNQRENVFELANRYQFYHGLALLIIAALFQPLNGQNCIPLATKLMTSGIVIFSGSLYLLAITNITWLGAITPIGGTLMILAWGLFAWEIYKNQPA